MNYRWILTQIGNKNFGITERIIYVQIPLKDKEDSAFTANFTANFTVNFTANELNVLNLRSF